MSRHHNIISEEFKNELAKEIGVYDTVVKEGWGAVSSRDCGNIVTAAIRYAERVFEQSQ